MDDKRKEIFIILLAAIVLGGAASFPNGKPFYIAIIAFILILAANIIIKKVVAYTLESDITTKPWAIYQFGLRKDAHFKEPVPVIWLPILFTLLTSGVIWWLAVLQFEVKARPERVSKRHGLYRFTEMTEWHVGLIAFWGVVTNLAIGIISYILGFEYFAQLNIFYAAWCLVPISNLDGTKILFANKALWITTAIVTVLLTGIAFSI
jgi:hypothetical protein